MPRVTSAKWDRTLTLNIPIFICIWIGLRAALEIHFRLIIRHRVLGYRLNTYRLEITGYSDDPWWREFYIDFEFSRLQFGNAPNRPNEDEAPPHGERADHMAQGEGRPPTPPRQSSSSGSTDNIQVVVNQNRHTPEPIPPPRYYISQHLNLLGANPTLARGTNPDDELEPPVDEPVSRDESEVEDAGQATPENQPIPDEDDDLPPLPMAPRPAPAQAMSPVGLDGLRVPVTAPPGHHIVHTPPRPQNPVQRTYSGWQEYFENLNNRANPNWGNNPMGPIVENSAPGTPLLFQTPPEGVTEEEASTSGVDADTEGTEESPQQEPSPVEETEGFTVDEWPALDEFLDQAFRPRTQD